MHTQTIITDRGCGACPWGRFRRTVLLLAVLSFLLPRVGQAQVSKKDLYNQWASVEFLQWKFTPKDFYYSWYNKKVLGITMKVPGKGVHDHGPAGAGIWGDGYVNQRWRQMTPLRLSAMGMALVEKGTMNAIKENWDSIAKSEVLKLMDGFFDINSILGGDKPQKEMVKDLEMLLDRLTGPREQRMKDAYDKCLDNMKIIGESFNTNGKKIEAYEEELKRMKRLREQVAIYSYIEKQSGIYGGKKKQDNGLGGLGGLFGGDSGPAFDEDRLLDTEGFNSSF